MRKYYIKEGYNDEIQISVYKVYKRRLFGLLNPKYITWFFYKANAERHIKYLTTPKP